MAAHVNRNTGNNEWYTPDYILDAARQVLGTIDCDPASSDIANERVKATTYYTIDNSGLDKPWGPRVWMNPPYAQPLIRQFAEGLVERLRTRDVHEAIVLVNNATETAWFKILDGAVSAVCFTDRRISFLRPDGTKAKRQPLQGQAILYFGDNTALFALAFGHIGRCYARVRLKVA